MERVVYKNIHKPGSHLLRTYEAGGGYQALRAALTQSPEEVIARVKASNLRGRGGAGFPAAVKWEAVRTQDAPAKYLVVNGDEGEPGTFKDRWIMEEDPHLLVEGMAICGYAAGTPLAYIYIRGEFRKSIQRVAEAVQEAYAAGILGDSRLKPGFRLDIKIRRGAGAYICGEEFALMESIEGKRGEPRAKPPFPVQVGLWKMPTVINKVAPLACVPDIVLKGGEWFKGLGVNGGAGTKVYCVSGAVKRPGAYELPMGVTAREIIYKWGGGVKGGELKAFAPGGASSGYLPASEVDVPMTFEALAQKGTMLGSAAVVVISDRFNMLDIARREMEFFAEESCGKCTPCRLGCQHMIQLLDALKEKRASRASVDLIRRLSASMMEGSLCGLGQAAPNCVTSVLRYFPGDIGLEAA